jgi:N-acetylglutamate synthase-like GNAT family acetyltransferase
MPQIRTAGPQDIPAIRELDRHLGEEALLRKIRAGEILVVEVSGGVVGLLRYGLFWDEIPFMHMLRIADAHQSRGLGKALVGSWEQEMRRLGYRTVLTSTQADENAQHFYRRLGYRDIGGFVLPDNPMEIVLLKTVS